LGEPEWELLVHPPAVFVRVARTGLAGYGTWKNIRKIGDDWSKGGRKVKATKEDVDPKRKGRISPFVPGVLGKRYLRAWREWRVTIKDSFSMKV
jgi:hypothetical protein